MDLGAMAMKGYSAFPKAPALLEPQHHNQDTHCGMAGLTPLQRWIRCILQPQPTRNDWLDNEKLISREENVVLKYIKPE